MRWRAPVVAAIVALSVACGGCSSASFDIGETPDASPAVDASDDAPPIDGATDTAQDTTSRDTAPVADAPTDAVAIDCPPMPGCSTMACGPLLMRDLEGMSAKGAPAFDATGFRCKTLTLCGVDMSCIYYDKANMLGALQSQEMMFYDGNAHTVADAAKLRLGVGAASQCGNPAVTFRDGDVVKITFDGGKLACIFLPAFTGSELTLYVAADGSTFYDAALTKLAKRRP